MTMKKVLGLALIAAIVFAILNPALWIGFAVYGFLGFGIYLIATIVCRILFHQSLIDFIFKE